MTTSDFLANLPLPELRSTIEASHYLEVQRTTGNIIRKIRLPYNDLSHLSKHEGEHVFLRLIPFLYFPFDQKFPQRLLLNSVMISEIFKEKLVPLKKKNAADVDEFQKIQAMEDENVRKAGGINQLLFCESLEEYHQFINAKVKELFIIHYLMEIMLVIDNDAAYRSLHEWGSNPNVAAKVFTYGTNYHKTSDGIKITYDESRDAWNVHKGVAHLIYGFLQDSEFLFEWGDFGPFYPPKKKGKEGAKPRNTKHPDLVQAWFSFDDVSEYLGVAKYAEIFLLAKEKEVWRLPDNIKPIKPRLRNLTDVETVTLKRRRTNLPWTANYLQTALNQLKASSEKS